MCVCEKGKQWNWFWGALRCQLTLPLIVAACVCQCQPASPAACLRKSYACVASSCPASKACLQRCHLVTLPLSSCYLCVNNACRPLQLPVSAGAERERQPAAQPQRTAALPAHHRAARLRQCTDYPPGLEGLRGDTRCESLLSTQNEDLARKRNS